MTTEKYKTSHSPVVKDAEVCGGVGHRDGPWHCLLGMSGNSARGLETEQVEMCQELAHDATVM